MEDSTFRKTPSDSERLACQRSWHCRRPRGKRASRLGRWILHVHCRPPRLNLSSHWLALIYVAYVDCIAIHMSRLLFSYAWAEAVDGQLSVCVDIAMGLGECVCVCVCVCCCTLIFAGTILSFRLYDVGPQRPESKGTQNFYSELHLLLIRSKFGLNSIKIGMEWSTHVPPPGQCQANHPPLKKNMTFF